MSIPAVMPIETRKRLGQFFTGEPLARLLAALAGAEDVKSVIDPMGGCGDMVVGALVVSGGPIPVAAAIEIEPVAAAACADRLEDQASIVRGSAFALSSWASFPGRWELVITNPPYVRYQTGAVEGGETFDIPSAEQIRAGLVDLFEADKDFSADEREAFLHCASRYSGLADLAVPSWLLCASKVAVGGRLAVLVPSTWLSRDYATPVLYVLRRFFDIEYVVEDKDMTWFDDALVRTNLVVARRTEDKGTAFATGAHLRLALPGSAADSRSIVGAAFPESEQPETDFARSAAEALRSGKARVPGFDASLSDESDLIEALRRADRRRPWPCTADVGVGSGSAVPERLRQLLPGGPPETVTLNDLGWTVGQGLRSGANDFFYVTRTAPGEYRSPILAGETLRLPDDAVRPAVRRQSELPASGLPAAVTETASYVLVLDGWALTEDIDHAEHPKPWKPMAGDLERLVRSAAAFCYQRSGATVELPSLSAVRTNIRRPSERTGSAARFWYQLPPLAARHVPALYVARVNSRHPQVFANPGGLIVDANFSTLWPATDDALPSPALLALLRTRWVSAALELLGTVLGGGALKVEATHLRRLPLPTFTPEQVAMLETVGASLMRSGSAGFNAADETVVAALGSRDPAEAVSAVGGLATALLGTRIGGLA